MGNIVVLPEVLRNQIAAGEVVDRPASVVKELVENAVDAGAGTIRVEIEGGGARRIVVQDDGKGMSPEDARLAMHRHATSKIRTEEDLHRLTTLGFRGEALAAISSVSKVVLETTRTGASEGITLSVHGGVEVSARPLAPAPGTRIVVQDLFFNTPARRKFLKSETTEAWHCGDVVTQRALADLERAYLFSSGGRTVINVGRARSLQDRLASLFGPEMGEGLVPVESIVSGIEVNGFVSIRDFRSSRRQQYFFVNGRPVRSFEAQQAVYQALGSLLPGGRHPVVFLFIRVPPETVDANVHPAKREIRFSDPAPVRAAVERAVRPAIYGFGTHGSTGTGSPAEGSRAEPRDFSRQPAPRPGEGSDAGVPPAVTTWQRWDPGIPGGENHGGEAPGMFPLGEEPSPFLALSADNVFSVGSAFLAIADGDGITFVDYHAAHERILYERFLKRQCRSERFLLPRKVVLGPAEHGMILGIRDRLEDFGIEVDDFGGNTLVVREAPEELAGCDLRDVFRDVVDLLGEKGGLDAADLRHEMAARLACRQAVKAGDRMRYPQIRSLVRDLEETELPETCPHGRPTRIRFSEADLRRLFKRT